MADCMAFPKTAEEFIEQYKFTDTKQEYTNGAELIPVFRVKQMLEHYVAEGNHVPGKCDYCQEFEDPWDAPMIASWADAPDRGICLYNGFLFADVVGGDYVEATVNFCPMCGRKLPPYRTEGE